ncbi:hypothetical protein ASZ78_003128 [Callipepla squamata]|uniref:Aprataxin and PNK-like factor n=1 Tax=Callipepla squamata TaxID=9009 RepID=A0A226N885_CALSU|nr:hypothetical protein ASZ78_003128 [Callipepla squamata]
MAGVRLQPRDGGRPVALPPGQTLLGRGPLLGITDKRVSRKHAILEVVGGQARIKPIHVDSCFYQSPESDQLIPLEAHEWHSLNFGDSFSLMLNKYIFKVLSAQPMESTERNDQESDAEAAVSVHPVEVSSSPSLPEPASSTSEMQGSTKIRKNGSASTHLVPSRDDDESEQLKSVQRKRVLPSWMLDKDLLVPRISEPIAKGGGRNKKSHGRGESDIESLKSEINVLQRKRLASEEMEENFEDEEQDVEEGRCESTSLSQKDLVCDALLHQREDAKRNPVHFQQFSHPNDEDYYETDTVTQGNNDNRPECPYGTACYRKNPQHKLEYKHTVPPVTERQTRQRTSKNEKRGLEEDSDNDGEPNEYDLNDSFIDDEEEECEPTDEDSDWEPSSEEKDNEDVETLVKEAQRFVKTKK